MAYSFATIMILLFIATPIKAQNRGGELEIVDHDGGIVGRFLNAHALVIGQSEYNNGWRRLPGVKEDVAAIKRLFEEQGFNVETIEDANSRDLKSGIRKFLNKYGYDSDARIILYFAGHGATIDLGGRRMGYIIPVDAPPARSSSDFLQAAIPMTQFETWAKQYISRHILFIFDSCFAGSVFRSQGSAPPAINRLISQPVRQFITSGDADEEVPDESIFRRELEYALRNGAADTNSDGYVSGTELGLYLFDRVSNYMNGRQNPRAGKLNDTNLDKGDFIFAIGGPPPKVDMTQGPEQTPVQRPAATTSGNRIGEDFDVRIIDGRTITITDYKGINKDVIIPPYIRNLPVTSIGDNAFKGKQITSVTIPNGVITIGDYAFQNNKISRIVIPDSVTHIGHEAFGGNSLAEGVTIGTDVSLGKYMNGFGVSRGFDLVYYKNGRIAGFYWPVGVEEDGFEFWGGPR
jgi:hypothetical protein